MNSFNWDNLKIFLAVARAQSALEASVLLGIDQSTISRRLHQLEKDIASRLFDRNSQGHRLTAAGHRLLEHVEKLETSITAIESEVFNDSMSLTGDIRLGATEGFGSYFLSPHLARFCARHPNISVELLPMPRNINLSKREADASVSLERPTNDQFVTSKLCDYRLLPYATAEYLDRHAPITTVSDLERQRWIDYVDDLKFTNQQFTLHDWLPGIKPFFCSTSVIAQFQAAQTNIGMAFLPCFLANTVQNLIPVLPDDIQVTRTFWLTAPEDRRELARVKVLWEYLRKVADANQGYLMGAEKHIRWVTP